MNYQDLTREQLEQALAETEKRLHDEEKERQELEKLARKHKADLENYRKKQPERKERWQNKALQELSEDLIEVIDNLERALEAADEDTAVVQGVEMVRDQLYQTLNA